MPRHRFSPSEARAAGVLGGRVTGEKLKWLRASDWRRKYPDVDAHIARAIYTAGYNAGHRKGMTTGYRRGTQDTVAAALA